MPELRAATLEELQAVRRSLEDINRVLPRQVQAEVQQVAVPGEELKGRLRRNFWLILACCVLLIVGAVVINRVTLQQAQRAAQRDLSAQITTCFLRPGAVSATQAAACTARFGDEYGKVQKRSAQATASFASLLEWAKEHGWKPPATTDR